MAFDDDQDFHSPIGLLIFEACFYLFPRGDSGLVWAGQMQVSHRHCCPVDTSVPQMREGDAAQPGVGGGDVQLLATRCPGCLCRNGACSFPWMTARCVLEAGLECARTFHSARCKCTFQFGIAHDL